jgi:phosphoglycerate kinase
MQSITKIPSLKGLRVLVRVDFNVPLKGNKILDARRIDASYQTITTILKKGGTPVLLAHLGDSQASLRPVATYLSKTFPVVFITNDLYDPRTIDILNEVPRGTVILLENVRRYPEEEKNTAAFGKCLASFGSYYVNDAFSVSHRAHASVVGIPKKIPAFAGYQLIREITALSKAVHNTKHPFVFILGGSKFKTKIPLLSQFIPKADKIVIAGALLNNFYMVAGFEVGDSVVEKGFEKPIKKILTSEKLLLPIDVIVLRGAKHCVTTPLEIEKNDVIVDIGPESVALITKEIKKAKLVVWNGPTGWYEKGFIKGTTGLAKAVTESTTEAIIGGGDTGVVVEKILGKNTENRKIFISTGGGAALEYLSAGTLVGIKALG